MKSLVYAIVFLILLYSCALAEQSTVEFAVIDGKTSDRVHLRAEPSMDSKSLGLYFSGTEIACVSEITSEWIRVVIGSQEGYVKSEYTRFNEKQGIVESYLPIGIVKTGINANIYSEPSERSSLIGNLCQGDTVMILGETSSHWYYVMNHDHAGYIHSDSLEYKSVDDSGRKANRLSLFYEEYLSTFPFEQAGREFWGIGTIDAGVVGRVHLRELHDETSQSYGTYYNGTKVVCVSDPNNLWTEVWIGNLIGNIPSMYIRMDNENPIENNFEIGRIIDDSILCSDPYDETVPTYAGDEKVISGQEIIIMGETHNNFFFVDTGSGWGYICCDNVDVQSNQLGD